MRAASSWTRRRSPKRKATAALIPNQRLFWIERAVLARAERDGLDRGDMHARRADVRNRRPYHVLNRFCKIVLGLDGDPALSKCSDLQAAATYTLEQEEPLTALLRHPEIPIHNNDTERDLRHVVTGGKNWQTFWRQCVGEVAERLYSLVMICKLAGIDPAACLEDALSLTRRSGRRTSRSSRRGAGR